MAYYSRSVGWYNISCLSVPFISDQTFISGTKGRIETFYLIELFRVALQINVRVRILILWRYCNIMFFFVDWGVFIIVY